MDILYSGHNQKYKIADGSEDVTTALSYIDIPVLFRYGGGKGFYFEAGPQIGILSGAKDKWDDETLDVKESLKGTNVALVLGAGGDFPVGENLTITAGVRLGYGFSDVTKDYSNDLFTDDEISVPTAGAHFDEDGDLNYKPTKRVFGGIHIGVMYNLPF